MYQKKKKNNIFIFSLESKSSQTLSHHSPRAKNGKVKVNILSPCCCSPLTDDRSSMNSPVDWRTAAAAAVYLAILLPLWIYIMLKVDFCQIIFLFNFLK